MKRRGGYKNLLIIEIIQVINNDYSQIKTKDYYNLTMDSVITILLLLYLKTLFVFKH